MKIGSLGDMSQSYAMQSRNAALKNDIQRLTLELASGKVADIRQAVGGNSAYINDVERSLKKLDGYNLATKEASQLAAGMQNALSQINTVTTTFRNTLLTSTGSALEGASSNILTQAKGTLDDVISALNTSVGGRSIFSGTATDTRTIAPVSDILSALRAAVAGAGSVDDILTATQSWFDDPTGFRAVGYLGSEISLAPANLSDEQAALLTVRGDDPALRNILRSLTIVALAEDPALGLTKAQQGELFQKVTPDILGANGALVELQSNIGFSEARIEAVAVRQSVERSTLEMARNDLLSINPYETATELEQVQFQLQSLYAITSRMSQLSLVNFL